MISKRRTLELRDIDGAYVVGMPVDQDRLRVALSNVASVGVFLAKPREVRWSAAEQDLGGYTLLSPYDLVDTSDDPMDDVLVRDFLKAVESDEEFVLQAHDQVGHRSGNGVDTPDELVAVAEK